MKIHEVKAKAYEFSPYEIYVIMQGLSSRQNEIEETLTPNYIREFTDSAAFMQKEIIVLKELLKIFHDNLK